jgi:CHAT domain-containing protein
VFKPGTAADSYLLLGDGTHLTLEDVRTDPRLRFDGVDLLTLSACETAVAEGQDVDGAEVEGLGALAQRRGAAAVLATLWPVADVSTGMFMQGMYALRQRNHLTKAEALREMQMAFIAGAKGFDAGGTDNERGAVRENAQQAPTSKAPPWPQDPRAPFSHPFFWAPFILMGNWL